MLKLDDWLILLQPEEKVIIPAPLISNQEGQVIVEMDYQGKVKT